MGAQGADRAHARGPISGGGILGLVDAVRALGWTPTSELSGMYHAGDIFQIGGSDGVGDRLWSGSCFESVPRDEAFVGSDVTTTLSAGVTIPIGAVANAGLSGSYQRRVVFGSPRHQALALVDLIPTEQCLDAVERFARVGENVGALQVLQEVLRATISEQTVGKVDAKGNFVAVDVALSGATTKAIGSDGPVTVGLRTVSVRSLPGLERIDTVVSDSRGLLTAEARQPETGRNLAVVLKSDDAEGLVSCSDDDAFHSHGLANTTHPRPGHESYVVVSAFRIYLDDGAVPLLDTSRLECSTPLGWAACGAGRAESNGGTYMAYVDSPLENPAAPSQHYVEWTYGNLQKSKKPMGPGFNDYDGDGRSEVSDADRDFGETLGLHFQPGTEGVVRTWGAAYLQFWDYDRQGCGRFNDPTCWVPVLDEGLTEKHWTFVTRLVETSRSCGQ